MRAIITFGLIPPCLLLAAGGFWKSKKPAEWTEADARKILSQSPWAKRTRVRMAVSTASPNTLPLAVGKDVGQVGVMGPNRTVLSPSTSEIINQQLTGNRPIPCLGWGTGIGTDQ